VTAVATAADEAPVWLPVGDEQLFGVLTRPTVEPNGVAVVMSSSGHWVTTIGTNRTYVRLARALAGEGYHVLRLDYLGVGESSGPAREYRLDEPFVGDTAAALEWLRGQGLRRFVLLGNCYGARVAIGTAQEAAPGEIAGVALFPPAVRDFGHGERTASLPLRELALRSLRRGGVRGVVDKLRTPGTRRRWRAALAKKASSLVRRSGNGRNGNGNGNGNGGDGAVQWVSPHFLRPLEDLVDRKVPVLLVFGRDEDFHLDFERGRAGRLGKVLDRAGDLVTIRLIDGNAHGLGTLEVQDDVLAAVTSWIPAAAPR
jgi:pimeloyl-ACP methyl ester carboxylesterase